MPRYQIDTEIEINAGPGTVWRILTDFATYPDWNPFIRAIGGEPTRGAQIGVRIQPSGARAMSFRPTILVADVGSELRWLGRFLLPGVFDGEHRFVIQKQAERRVLFRQSERFSGILLPLLRGGLERDTKRGFEEMNLALKARAEEAQRLQIRKR
jgi:hypothetical protein